MTNFSIFASKLNHITKMNIRDNVKAICKLRGITQKELADKIDMKENTLNIILGKGNPQLATIERIAVGLGVTASELIADKIENQLPPQPIIEHVPYLRCPHCGKEIEMYVKAMSGADTANEKSTPNDDVLSM